MPSGDPVTDVAFFQVPLPQSGDLVNYLSGSAVVALAAAVYSGVDVIGVLDGSRESIDAAYEAFLGGDAPIDSVDRFPADDVIPGASHGSHQHLARSACAAFVRCTIRVPEVTVPYASTVLSRISGVVRLFPNADKGEIVLEVLTEGKKALDDAVMLAIQGQASVVRSTRTYAVINSMQWYRGEIQSEPRIFISVAEANVAFARDLRRRIEADCEIQCWMFTDIPLGTKSWTGLVDEAIREAQQHIFVTSVAALESTECAREFGLVDALFDAEDVCCLVLPDCEITDLPIRYQQRQCLNAADFFAYPHLTDWLLRRNGQANALTTDQPA